VRQAALRGAEQRRQELGAAREPPAAQLLEPVQEVLPGRDDSYEGLLHEVALPAFALNLADEDVRAALEPERLSRAIGVIYRPQTERQSHYFRARLADQFDALIHVDETRALRPLDPATSWDRLTPSS